MQNKHQYIHINRLYAEEQIAYICSMAVYSMTLPVVIVYTDRDSRKRMIIITTGSVQKLNSYILISYSLHVGEGCMQRVIRFSNLTLHTQRTCIHGYQHITIYVHSAFASLSILSLQPYMHPHTTQSPLNVQLRATSYI